MIPDPLPKGNVCDPISSFVLPKEETVSPAKEERTLVSGCRGSPRRFCTAATLFLLVDLTLPPTAAAALWDAFAMLRV